MRILLIEDDRALCTALLPALQAAGYTVDTCTTAQTAKPFCAAAHTMSVYWIGCCPGWTVLACCGPPAPRDVPPRC